MQRIVLCAAALFLVTLIAACGGSGSSTAALTKYDRPAKYVSYSSTKLHPMGGAMQGVPLNLQQGVVSTPAGTAGTIGFVNYTGTASSSVARFNQPNDITTYDGSTYYVADYGNSAIRQITSAGVVTTMKFTDAATLLPVTFSRPTAITTDGTNLYVADSGLNVVRVIDLLDNSVITIGSATDPAGSVDSAVKADVRFNQPTGITTDGVNIYVADYGNRTVRWIKDTGAGDYAVYTMAGAPGVIGTTANTPTRPEDARFSLPSRITTDGKFLYLTDIGNRTICKIDIITGYVTTIAGASGALGLDNGTLDGFGTAARFNQPNGITSDGSSLYVTDSYHNSVRVIDDLGGLYLVSTLSLPAGSLHFPLGITTNGVSLFIADPFTLKLDVYTYSNSIIKISN